MNCATIPNFLAEWLDRTGIGSGDLFVKTLNSASGKMIQDCVIAEADKQIEGLWRIRDAAAGVIQGAGFMHAYQVSLYVGDMGYFGDEVV